MYLQVDLKIIEENLLKVKKHTNNDKIKTMAVLKANAYGFGAVNVGKHIENMIDYIGVGLINEAIELRNASIEKPILILAPTYEFDLVYQNNIIVSICSINQYKQLLEWCQKKECRLEFHLKIDTGMHRFGIKPKELKTFFELYNKEFTIMSGVFSHFATTIKRNSRFVKRQKILFDKVVGQINSKGHKDLLIHMANSENCIDYKESHYGMVRLGNCLYGPCNSKSNIKLKKASIVKSSFMEVRSIRKGERVGYGLTYRAKKDMTIGIIPFGIYEGNGYSRKLIGIGYFELFINIIKQIVRYLFKKNENIYYNNLRLKTIGAISMQFTIVEIPDNSKEVVDETLSIVVHPIMIKERVEKRYVGGCIE